MRAHQERHAVVRGDQDTNLSVQLPGCIVRQCSLSLPDNLSEEQWIAIGQAILGVRSATRWWLGDWWASGEHRYGNRRALVEGELWDGPSLQGCMDVASVARAFETSRRREALSFGHHREVASLPADQADALLDWAGEPLSSGGRARSVRALREERARRSQPSPPRAVVLAKHSFTSAPLAGC